MKAPPTPLHDPPELTWLDLLFGWVCWLAGVLLLGCVLWLMLYVTPDQLTVTGALVGWVATYLGVVAIRSAKPCIHDGLAWWRWRRAHPKAPPEEIAAVPAEEAPPVV